MNMPLFGKKEPLEHEHAQGKRTDTRNFYQRMEQEIDFDNEYRKLEVLLFSNNREVPESMNTIIRRYFLAWRHRDIYTSFEELRNAVGFPVRLRDDTLEFGNSPHDMNDYFAYSEMIIGILIDFEDQKLFPREVINGGKAIVQNIERVLSKVGYRFIVQNQDGRVLVCKKDAAASAVAEISPQAISDAVLEYNHYLLKGNISRKRELLSLIALDLEPRRKEIGAIANTAGDDFFFLVNNLNIRHNNTDASDKAKYKPEVANMQKATLEELYDKTYRLALFLYLSLEYNQYKTKFRALRDLITNKQ